MDEEKQTRPLAPRDRYSRSDEMFVYKEKKSGRKERSSKCLVCILFLIVILGAFVLMFSVLFLRVRSPSLEISSMTVRNLKFFNGNSSNDVSMNATLEAQVKVRNTNYGGFKFDDGNATALYRGTKMGEGSIKIGSLNWRDSKTVKVVMEIKSKELLKQDGNTTRIMSNLSSSMHSGIVNVTNFAKLDGMFNLFDRITKRRTSEMNCSMSLVLRNNTVQNLLCN